VLFYCLHNIAGCLVSVGLGLFGKFGLLTSGVYIVGRGRAIVGWSEGGKPDDRSHAQVCSGRGGAVVSGEGSITCESSGYWYALPIDDVS
jgi:hypothetical protein